LDALYRSYELIQQDKTTGRGRYGLSLHRLIGQLLKPYEIENRARHISIEGDDIVVDSGKITAFSLILHELATNAAKYGALSMPEGTIRIATALIENQLQIRWEETGGTTSAAGKTHSGFGLRLVQLLVEGQLKGSFSLITEIEGMNILIEIPIETAVL
jgi:two-component sensor histidine kinase